MFLLPFKGELNVSGKHLLGKQSLENLKVCLFKELQLLGPKLPLCPLVTECLWAGASHGGSRLLQEAYMLARA